MNDETVEAAMVNFCLSLGGEWNSDTNQCEESALCRAERKIMALSKTGGTDSCGKTWRVLSKKKEYAASNALFEDYVFAFPDTAIPGSLTVHVLGGGGGGASGDRNHTACGGKAATEAVRSFPSHPVGDPCIVRVGRRGAGQKEPVLIQNQVIQAG